MLASRDVDQAVIYRKRPGLLETDLDRELLIVDPETQVMFSLNSVARFIWPQLETANVDSIASKVCERFDVDLKTAHTDTTELIEERVKSGLIYATRRMG